MDNSRFDSLAKVFAARRPRRAALPLLAAFGLGLAARDDASAAKSNTCQRKPGECETCKKGKCQRKNGKKRCKAGKVQPKPEGTACSSGRCQNGQCLSQSVPTLNCVLEPLATTCARGCGTRLNNCNQSIVCPCPGGQNCLPNGTCARPCTTAAECADCGSGGAFCGRVTTEVQRNCIEVGEGIFCSDRPLCTSTADCPLGFQCQICTVAGQPDTQRCADVAVCPA